MDLTVSKRTGRSGIIIASGGGKHVLRWVSLVAFLGAFRAGGEPPVDTNVAREWLVPVAAADRRSWADIRLTAIGRFGELRKARPGIPAHFHTGVDIRRPSERYDHEPIFAAAAGTVVSVRDDGPFAQVLVEHLLSSGDTVWTVYEHVAGIRISLGDRVGPRTPLARFMTISELEQYGWQFDHVHFEVMRKRPPALAPTDHLPQRRFGTYALMCYSREQLERRYFDPWVFLERCWSAGGWSSDNAPAD
ncbi:MAG: peptidoglycan DD-metalloendopeptidase family protein [Chitinivibrionales bacterium]|nr:peptidoglycan DD-metalloendopeptidase family protein [Chitinivibrionales bacterium]